METTPALALALERTKFGNCEANGGSKTNGAIAKEKQTKAAKADSHRVHAFTIPRGYPPGIYDKRDVNEAYKCLWKGAGSFHMSFN